jgi:hypothetical protein
MAGHPCPRLAWALLALWCALGAAAGQVRWTADVSGSWTDPARWSSGAVPGAGDTVVLGGGAYTVTLSRCVRGPAARRCDAPPRPAPSCMLRKLVSSRLALCTAERSAYKHRRRPRSVTAVVGAVVVNCSACELAVATGASLDASSFTQTAGIVSGAGQLTVGALLWEGGSQTGSGQTRSSNAGVSVLNGSVLLGRSLSLSGTTSISGTINAATGATLVVSGAATLAEGAAISGGAAAVLAVASGASLLVSPAAAVDVDVSVLLAMGSALVVGSGAQLQLKSTAMLNGTVTGARSGGVVAACPLLHSRMPLQ